MKNQSSNQTSNFATIPNFSTLIRVLWSSEEREKRRVQLTWTRGERKRELEMKTVL